MSNEVKQRGAERKLITRLEDVPETFASREEEAEWWDSHDIDDSLLESGPEVRAELFKQLGAEDPQEGQS
ncbi:MAG: hypothetical protein WD314_05075 [Trueperaceae bacterium]